MPVPRSAAAPAVTHLVPAGGQRGTTVEVTAAGTFDKWPVKVWVERQGGLGRRAGKEKGKLPVTVATDAEPGVVLAAAPRRNRGEPAAAVRRRHAARGGREGAERRAGQGRSRSSGSAVVNGQLAKTGDVDCFAVTLKKGQTLVAALEAHRTLRSPMDAVLQVVSADGFVLDQNHDHHGLDPQLAFTAPRDGTYIVRVFAFPAPPDSSIRFFGSDACVYRLTLTTAEFVDFVTPLAVEHLKAAKVRLHGWNLSAIDRDLPPDDAPTAVVPGTGARVRRESHPCLDLTRSKPDKPLARSVHGHRAARQTGLHRPGPASGE